MKVKMGGGKMSLEKLATNLPTSKAGEPMGESSVAMVKMPSNLRSGKGWVTSAEIRERTL